MQLRATPHFFYEGDIEASRTLCENNAEIAKLPISYRIKTNTTLDHPVSFELNL